MGDNGTTTATRSVRPHPLSAQERMALKGWIGPLCAPLATGDEDAGAEAPVAVAEEDLVPVTIPCAAAVPSGSPHTVPAIPAGWHERPAEYGGERRVERRRAERRGLGDVVGADAQVFSVALTRRDITLMGCCMAVGLLVGSVFF